MDVFKRKWTAAVALFWAMVFSAVSYDAEAQWSSFWTLPTKAAASVSSSAFPLLAPDGSASAPSYSFSSETNTGMYRSAASQIGFSISGTKRAHIGSAGLVADGLLLDTANADVQLLRDAANTLAQRNGTNPQIFRIYNTFTDASNYERLTFSFASNIPTIQPEAAGTGTGRILALQGQSSLAGYLGLAVSGGYAWVTQANVPTNKYVAFGFSPNTTSGYAMSSGAAVMWNASATDATSGSYDVAIFRDAAQTTIQKNGTNAQVRRLSFSTTGPVYWQETARTAGALYTGVGGAAQVSYAQTTAPTCTTNCGTSPSVVGTDTAGIVTMGASGVPASGWVVTFNGTWPAAPSCVVQSALTTMVVGKMPIAVQTSTTTMTVTTNGTAPGNSDKYAYHCIGVS